MKMRISSFPRARKVSYEGPEFLKDGRKELVNLLCSPKRLTWSIRVERRRLCVCRGRGGDPNQLWDFLFIMRSNPPSLPIVAIQLHTFLHLPVHRGDLIIEFIIFFIFFASIRTRPIASKFTIQFFKTKKSKVFSMSQPPK